MDIVLERDQESATALREELLALVRDLRAAEETPYLSEFSTADVLEWMGLQAKDLAAYSVPIRKLQEDFELSKVDPLEARFAMTNALIENLTSRTANLVSLKAEAHKFNELRQTLHRTLRDNQADISKLGTTNMTPGILEQMKALTSYTTAQVREIQTSAAVIKNSVHSNTAVRILQAAREGKRPIRDALVAELGSLHEAASSMKPASHGQDDEASSTATPNSMEDASTLDAPQVDAEEYSGPNPQIQLRRKELGGALSVGEVFRRTEVYFKALWAEGIEQRHCGAILVFEPSVSRGISIHDLLGLSNTDPMLDQAKTQIMARFARRD
jgi:hypothetical protein